MNLLPHPYQHPYTQCRQILQQSSWCLSEAWQDKILFDISKDFQPEWWFQGFIPKELDGTNNNCFLNSDTVGPVLKTGTYFVLVSKVS